MAFFWGAIACQYLCFFWGGYHLAKAKGYTYTIILPGLLGPCLQVLLLGILLVLPDKCPQFAHQTAGRKKCRTYGSHIERIIHYRKNALLGNALGLLGILIGLSLVLFPAGLLADADTVQAIGIVVFLCGYSAVITGCWWWVKAKGWIDAVIFIGLLPLAVLVIPGVRLIFVAIPKLLPISMVMMPLILMAVVLALPDKSGIPKRRRSGRS